LFVIINRDSPRIKKRNKVVINGQEVILSKEEYIQHLNALNEAKAEKERVRQFEIAEQRQAFLLKIKELKDTIKDDADSCEDAIIKKVLTAMYKTRINNNEDYERLKFLYNDGELRTNIEVREYDKHVSNIKHINNFDSERHTNNTLGFFIPFLISFILALIAFTQELTIYISLPVSLVVALTAGCFGCLISSYNNISNAEEYGISADDDRVQDETNNAKVGTVSIIGGTVHTLHKTKNAVKDLTNVDGWKEMK
jgi:hypothetical protein